MDDRVWARWPRDGATVYVETFAPCLRDVEFLPARYVRDVTLYAFYSEDLARRSLAWIGRRYPQTALLARRVPLELNRLADAREYRDHVRAAMLEARAFPRAAKA